MLFYSPAFLPFFLIVFGAYWLMPWQRARTLILLTASFYFYATWNKQLALLIGVTSTFDYAIGRGLDAAQSPRTRKLLVAASLIANLSLLAYFKYVNFFLDSLEASLALAGVSVSWPTVSVILPIGISFYTFEAINYTVDVYQRRVVAEKRLDHFLLFITFFPHLVAGPIVRARDFLPQIDAVKRWNWRRLQLGANLFLLGLFKKLVIADRLAQLVDPVFADPGQYKTAVVWMATVSYALQIYCDFSGYSDMALGLAHSLGFKLTRNFSLPYLARNVSEFWRRWHISLSTWLRDYLFIPLGGSRGGAVRTTVNLFITMSLGGLWHGATWTFAAWGLLHGALLSLHRLLQALCRRSPRLTWLLNTSAGTGLRVAATFFVICLTWVLFRASSFETAWEVYERMFVPSWGKGAPLSTIAVVLMWGFVAIGHLWPSLPSVRRLPVERWPAPVQGLAYAAIAVVLLVLAPEGGSPFIYFQF
ncbi:MAG: MBOAT family protein [Pirellulales bacterium]